MELADNVLHAVQLNTIAAYQKVGVTNFKRAIKARVFPADTPRGYSRWTFDRFVEHLRQARQNMGIPAMRARVRLTMRKKSPQRSSQRSKVAKRPKAAKRPKTAKGSKAAKRASRRRFVSKVDQTQMHRLETQHFYVRRTAWNGLLDVRPRCMPAAHESVEGHAVTCQDSTKRIHQLKELHSGFVVSFEGMAVHQVDAMERAKRGEQMNKTIYDKFLARPNYKEGLSPASVAMIQAFRSTSYGAHVHMTALLLEDRGSGGLSAHFPSHPQVASFPHLVEAVHKPGLRYVLVLLNLPSHYNLVVVDVAAQVVHRFEPLGGHSRDAQITPLLRGMCRGRMKYMPRLLSVAPQAMARGPFCASWMLMMAFLIAINASDPQVKLADITRYFEHKSRVSRAKGKKAWDENKRYLFRKVGLFTVYLWELAQQ